MTLDEAFPPPPQLIDHARQVLVVVQGAAHPFDRAVAAYITRLGPALCWHHLRWVFATWHAMIRSAR